MLILDSSRGLVVIAEGKASLPRFIDVHPVECRVRFSPPSPHVQLQPLLLLAACSRVRWPITMLRLSLLLQVLSKF
jgi:hypothetical protein